MKNLSIKGYKNIERLSLKNLGQVNLFTGKNNTGKSSLLEAIAIHVSRYKVGFILDILEARGEWPSLKSPDEGVLLRALSSLFQDRAYTSRIIVTEQLEDIENVRTGVEICFVSLNSIPQIEGRNLVYERFAEHEDGGDGISFLDSEVALQISDLSLMESPSIYPLRRFRQGSRMFSWGGEQVSERVQWVGAKGLSVSELGVLWDQVVLTDLEEYVVRGLQIIEPSIRRVSFVEVGRQRRAVVRLNGYSDVMPIQSMGDGINRILTIILATVNSANGVLLIDEFENGLHHTVQRQLWDIIYQLSEVLNIQVFATTHSTDCIAAFEDVLNQREQVSGKLIRLERTESGIQTVEFDSKELEIATDNHIEIR